MTRLKFLTYLVVLNGLILLNSCNDDNSLKIIDEPNLVNQSKGTQSNGLCDMEIYVTYDNLPPGADVESANEIYMVEMSQYFTICLDVQSKNCPNVFKWTVNGEEYDAYIDNGRPGVGTNNNDSDGDPGMQEVLPFNNSGCTFNSRSNYPF